MGTKHRVADTSFWGRNMLPHQVQMEENLSCPFAPDEEACLSLTASIYLVFYFESAQ